MLHRIYEKYKGRVNLWYAFFAMMFSAMLVISRHIFYTEAEVSTIDNVFVTDFHFVDFIAWIGILPVVYLAMKAVAYMCTVGGGALFREKETYKRGIWVLAGAFALLMLVWFPYLPSYWPGGIYADTVDSIRMALYKDALDSHNPVWYTMLWRFMFWITGAFSGEGEYGGLKLFTVVQTIVLALALAYFIYRCCQWGLHKAFLLFWLLIFALFPLYPFYGISLWKDTLFSVAVFLFSIFLYDTFSRGDGEISGRQLAEYCLFSICIIFLRNNGLYVFAFYAAMILLLCLKRKKTAVKIAIASVLLLFFSGMLQGPVYDWRGYNIDRTTESLGIPLQQIAYIVSTDGVVSEADREVLEQMLPMERWRELYNPIVADPIKFAPEFGRAYLEENAGEFMRTYLHMICQNPVKAWKAYLLSSMGFWDIFESSSTAYICNFHFGNAEYFMSDYFDYYLHFSFRNLVEPKGYLSAALFAWLMLGVIFVCLAQRNVKGLIAIMPGLGVWLSVMIAAPVAFSFRYVYALFLCMPLYLLIGAASFRHGPSGEEPPGAV